MTGEMRFDGQVAIVTGAGGPAPNLGRSFAMLLAALGAKVVVNDLGVGADGRGELYKASAEAVTDEIRKAGGEAVPDAHDVGDPGSAKAIVQTAIDKWGRIDILVNNAGSTAPGLFEEISDADVQRVVNAHLLGNIWMCRAVWPHMKRAPVWKNRQHHIGGGIRISVSCGLQRRQSRNIRPFAQSRLGRRTRWAGTFSRLFFSTRADISIRHPPSRASEIILPRRSTVPMPSKFPTSIFPNTAVAGGYIDLALAAPQASKSFTDGGNVRPIAIADTKRHKFYPDVPTTAEAGMPGFVVTFWAGLMGPARLPQPVLTLLQNEVAAMLTDPEIVGRLDKLGYVPNYKDSPTFRDFVVADLAKWTATAKSAHISL